MSHTKGPWRVTDMGGSTQWIEADCGMGVARIAIVDDGAGCQQGNAALIAAAPDLLEKLEAVKGIITNVFEVCPFCCCKHTHESDCLFYGIETAIRKARGEE